MEVEPNIEPSDINEAPIEIPSNVNQYIDKLKTTTITQKKIGDRRWMIATNDGTLHMISPYDIFAFKPKSTELLQSIISTTNSVAEYDSIKMNFKRYSAEIDPIFIHLAGAVGIVLLTAIAAWGYTRWKYPESKEQKEVKIIHETQPIKEPIKEERQKPISPSAPDKTYKLKKGNIVKNKKVR